LLVAFGCACYRDPNERHMVRPPNSYSQSWFEHFHVPIAEERTAKEVEFICGVGPLPGFPKVLDVCCGMGRHARALAGRGYSVTGLERDPVAISKARESGGGPHYIEADVREYCPHDFSYDLVIMMSQSFGHFDAPTNSDVLHRLANSVRPGGRIILDLWNGEFFAAHQEERKLETPAGIARENKRIAGDRLFVHVTYPDGAGEDFEWQLFTPVKMKSLAEAVGCDLLISCTDFNASTRPHPESPRIQFVLQKRKS
jgi:SAM-dependent methyltransferase